MRIISSDEIETVLAFPELLETLRRAYRSETVVPAPARYDIERPALSAGRMTISSAWTNFTAQGHCDRGYIGCHIAVHLPSGDAPAASAASAGVYLLMSGAQGTPIALIDGPALAKWRSAAQHALAVSYLAREDVRRLLVLGDVPRVASRLEAYRSVRDIRSVLFIGPHHDTCRALMANSAFPKTEFGCTDDLAGAIAGADVILCSGDEVATLARHEIQPGTHIDLCSAPAMGLPVAIQEVARLFVGDRQDGNATDLEDVAADLRELAQGQKAGRRFYGQITLFLSGDSTGLADLATAGHVFLRT